MWETFREVGLLAWPILVAGVLGSLAAVLALILAARRAPSALAVAVVATALGALAALAGGAGVIHLRRLTESAIVDTQASPLEAEKLRREGYGEARRPARLGLICAAFPLLAGAVAMFVARRRRPSSAATSPALPRRSSPRAGGWRSISKTACPRRWRSCPRRRGVASRSAWHRR